MIKEKQTGQLIVLSAPSGCGKDTICRELLGKNKNLWHSVSCTTRKPRSGETEGVDYYFLTKEEFEDKIKNDEFIEYAMYNGNYYGTLKDKVVQRLQKGTDVILVIEVQGALQIKQKIEEAIFIFILPPTMKELKKRLENRKTETKEMVLKRFKKAYEELNEITKYNYVVINDTIENATNKIESILISEKCRVDRIEEIYLDTEEEGMHELLIQKDFENVSLSDKL